MTTVVVWCRTAVYSIFLLCMCGQVCVSPYSFYLILEFICWYTDVWKKCSHVSTLTCRQIPFIRSTCRTISLLSSSPFLNSCLSHNTSPTYTHYLSFLPPLLLLLWASLDTFISVSVNNLFALKPAHRSSYMTVLLVCYPITLSSISLPELCLFYSFLSSVLPFPGCTALF